MKDLTGEMVEFHAVRIVKGNPVRGVVISEDKDSIQVKLEHTIEGLVTNWYEGEERWFDKKLINSIKIIT